MEAQEACGCDYIPRVYGRQRHTREFSDEFSKGRRIAGLRVHARPLPRLRDRLDHLAGLLVAPITRGDVCLRDDPGQTAGPVHDRHAAHLTLRHHRHRPIHVVVLPTARGVERHRVADRCLATLKPPATTFVTRSRSVTIPTRRRDCRDSTTGTDPTFLLLHDLGNLGHRVARFTANRDPGSSRRCTSA